MTFEILTEYRTILNQEGLSHPIAAVKALLNAVKYICAASAEDPTRQVTVSELTHQINIYINQLKEANSSIDCNAFKQLSRDSSVGERGDYPSIAVLAGINIFTRLISQYSPAAFFSAGNLHSSYSLNSIDVNGQAISHTDLTPLSNENPADYILRVGTKIVSQLQNQLPKLIQYSKCFVKENKTIMTIGYSRSVIAVLCQARNQNLKFPKQFKIICAEGSPSNSGIKSCNYLKSQGIDVTLIPDSSVAYYMQDVDLVMVGAEAIVENGGFVNAIGTFQMAIAARHFNKPFYCVAESCKFVKRFPLHQKDIYPVEQKKPESVPMVDYTPPDFVTLFITDLGALSPNAISYEIMKSA